MNNQNKIWSELSDSKKANELSLSLPQEEIKAKQIAAIISVLNSQKPFFDERLFTPPIVLIIDKSTSMSFSSSKSLDNKFCYAKTMAIALEIILKSQGFKVNIIEKELDDINDLMPKSQIVLFSDFMVETIIIDKLLANFSEQKIEGWLIQTIDFKEANFIYDKEMLFAFADKKQKPIFVKPKDLKQSYANKFDEHCSNILNISEKNGFFFARGLNCQNYFSLVSSVYLSFMEKFDV